MGRLLSRIALAAPVLVVAGVLAAQSNRGLPQRSVADAPAKLGTYHALLIAAQNYADPSIPRLDNPIRDAERLRSVLVGRYEFDPKNVQLLRDPTRDELVGALYQLSQSLGDDDNLLVFYAGHGHWDEAAQQGYWLPSDAQRANPSKWVSNGDIRDAVLRINSRHTLLITDACFSGGIFKTRDAFAEAGMPGLSRLYATKSRKAITSGAKETVPDKSVFLDYTIKRLQDNQSPFLDAQELFASLQVAVMNNSPTTPQYGVIYAAGDEGGDFLFPLRAVSSDTRVNEPPPARIANAVPGTEWSPTAIRLYEGPTSGVPYSDVRYATRFNTGSLRSIFIDLSFSGRAGATPPSNLSCSLAGSFFTTNVQRDQVGTLDPSWSTFRVSMQAIGWNDPGHWSLGSYTVKCSAGTFSLGSAAFDVVQEVPGTSWTATGLRFYAGGESYVPPADRVYGTRFSRSKLSRIYTEMSFSLTAGSQLGSPIACSIDGPGMNGPIAPVVPHPDPSWTSAVQPTGGYGWPTPGLWRIGDYRVSCSVANNPIGSATFTVVQDLPASSGTWTTKDFRLYAGNDSGVTLANRVYSTRFSKETLSRLYVEFTLERPAGSSLTHGIDCAIDGPGMHYKLAPIDPKPDPSWTSFYWANSGWGWTTPGNWPVGDYTVSCTSGDTPVGSVPFTVVENVPASGGAKWSLNRVRIYGGPSGGVPLDNRVYATKFTRSSLSYLFVEMTFDLPSGSALGRTIDCSIEGNNVHGQATIDPHPDPSWTSLTTTSNGWGWAAPGNWPVGHYDVSCALAPGVQANTAFDVTDNDVAPERVSARGPGRAR